MSCFVCGCKDLTVLDTNVDVPDITEDDIYVVARCSHCEEIITKGPVPEGKLDELRKAGK